VLPSWRIEGAGHLVIRTTDPMRRHFVLVWTTIALVVVVLSLAGAARAQNDPSGQGVPRGGSGAVVVPPASGSAQPAPPPVTLTPPMLKRDEGAVYPKQALQDGMREHVDVMLVLEIDATGLVKRASVEKSVGHGFDEAALAAAAKLVFDPASRNGKPVAARIRFKYGFDVPPAALVGRLLDAKSGQPITSARIVARAADGREYTTTSADGGRWTLPKLPTGKYRVTLSASGYKTQIADLDLNPGEETSVLQRLEVDTSTPSTALGGNTPPPAGSGAAPPPPIDDIIVKGVRPSREVTVRTIEQREMNRIPGTNGDALRSLQNLPGVARAPGLAGLLIVRGSAPQDTNYFIDGTLVPIVYHFGGLSSVVPTEMLEKIDFYPGNFSSQYGRVMGGIVDVGIKDPKKDRIHGLAQADLIDARVLAEGPIGNTGWNFAVGGRRSYVDVWLKPALTASGAGVTTAPVYYDYQALVQRDFDSHSSIRFMFFGSDDRLDILIKSVNASEPGLAGGISTHTGFWRLQARYKNRFDKDTELRVTAAVGEDFVDFNLGDNFFHLDSYPITTRAELARKITRGVTANFGLDLLYTPYDVTVRFPPFPRPGEPPGGPFLSRPAITTHDQSSVFRPGMYTELEITPWHGGRIVPGARLDYAKDTQSWDLAPRFIARQDITDYPRTTLKGGAGIYFQPPQPQETNPVFGMAGLASNRAIHYGLGVEREVTKNIEVSFEGFYKQLDYLVLNKVGNVGNGRAYGTELLLRYKPDARFFGWLAYTLSRSERRDQPGDPLRLAQFDQTHILTILGSYRLGRGWEIGARFRLVSGNLYTPNNYGFYDTGAGAYLPLQSFPLYGSRLPVFHQLDIRVDKTWLLKGGARFGMYLDVQNVYNQGNVEGVTYNYNYTQSAFVNGLPIIPSLGARIEY
jgi:TonB family protein